MNNFHKYGGWIISDEISMRDDEKVNFFFFVRTRGFQIFHQFRD